MKKYFKSMFLTLLIVAMLAALFTGCGTQKQTPGTQDPGTKTPQDKPGENPSTGIELTVASVNNGPMVTMSELSSEFTKQTGIKVNYVMLTENDIRSNSSTW